MNFELTGRRFWELAASVSLLPLLCSSTQATTTTDWFDFTGWDHSAIISSGQTFLNIEDGIDVDVTGTGVNEVISVYDGENIRTGAHNGSMEFTFSFTEPLDLKLDVQSTDLLEVISITSPGTVQYHHVDGAMPSVVGDMAIGGNGFGFDEATGSARGFFTIENADSVTWAYSSSAPDKYEWFRLGTVTVPEPATLGLFGIGLLGLAMRRRRFVSERCLTD